MGEEGGVKGVEGGELCCVVMGGGCGCVAVLRCVRTLSLCS